MKSKLWGLAAIISLTYLIGVAGNSDLGLESSVPVLILKLTVGILGFYLSLLNGGFFE